MNKWQWLMIVWLITDLPIAALVTGRPLSPLAEIIMRTGDVVFVASVLYLSGFWNTAPQQTVHR